MMHLLVRAVSQTMTVGHHCISITIRYRCASTIHLGQVVDAVWKRIVARMAMAISDLVRIKALSIVAST